MNIEEMKEWIDNATIEELLYKLKHEPEKSPWFISGKLGEYLLDKIALSREESPDAYRAACVVVFGNK